jgi:hypothetical protein
MSMTSFRASKECSSRCRDGLAPSWRDPDSSTNERTALRAEARNGVFLPTRSFPLSRLSPGYPVCDRSLYVERPHPRGSVNLMLDQLPNRRVVLPTVPFRIASRLPKAQCENVVGVRLRDQYDLVHEALLRFEDGQHLLMNRVAESLCFSPLSLYLNDSREHGSTPFELGLSKRTGRSPRQAAPTRRLHTIPRACDSCKATWYPSITALSTD